MHTLQRLQNYARDVIFEREGVDDVTKEVINAALSQELESVGDHYNKLPKSEDVNWDISFDTHYDERRVEVSNKTMCALMEVEIAKLVTKYMLDKGSRNQNVDAFLTKFENHCRWQYSNEKKKGGYDTEESQVRRILKDRTGNCGQHTKIMWHVLHVMGTNKLGVSIAQVFSPTKSDPLPDFYDPKVKHIGYNHQFILVGKFTVSPREDTITVKRNVSVEHELELDRDVSKGEIINLEGVDVEFKEDMPKGSKISVAKDVDEDVDIELTRAVITELDPKKTAVGES